MENHINNNHSTGPTWSYFTDQYIKIRSHNEDAQAFIQIYNETESAWQNTPLLTRVDLDSPDWTSLPPDQIPD